MTFLIRKISVFFTVAGVISAGTLLSFTCTKRNEGPSSGVYALLDRPDNIAKVFHPVKSSRPSDGESRVYDIPVDPDVTIGAKLHLHNPDYPTILLFHGNGEIVNHYDSVADQFNRIGVNLFVVDFRGYGWSSGSPSFRYLLEDAPVIVDFAIEELKRIGASPAIYIMGRSLGSAPAVRLAREMDGKIRGLILESAYGDATSLIRLLHLRLNGRASEIAAAISNHTILEKIQTPILIIHGMNDRLIPVDQARLNYQVSSSDRKYLKIIGQTGHNNLMLRVEEYYPVIQKFINDTNIYEEDGDQVNEHR